MDFDGDGTIDTTTSYTNTYNTTSALFDNNTDGTTDKVVTYEYDLFTGQLSAELIDNNNDGTTVLLVSLRLPTPLLRLQVTVAI
ncbi:hypothetical protein H6G68_17605 [Anabaena catenula FACHB-362]|uniref:Uncharacterized protein n=1 Tax=Anabaena catenula FACHB-362 TaxID=2692877 RepID=A0ABR8J5W5_9NOST|nr:hypothetical protein [Anabaena catenula]MBD2693550.1 hypothetical protein [Anabaena catenula FACHB-362]